jgi:predicted ATPase/DNA-binding winged helix-turn-helix (wHTH) protein
MTERSFSFGPFRLLPDRRVLLKDGQPQRLGARALDLLVLLVERAGSLVSQAEIMTAVWCRTHVDEANIRVHMTALRKLLGTGHAGERYIVNLPGRGYMFVAPMLDRIEAPAVPAAPFRMHLAAPDLVGRETLLTDIAAQLRERRFVTLAGPGGIGKTALALALGDRLQREFPSGACVVDFCPLTDGRLVAGTVAAAIGFCLLPGQGVLALAEALRDRRMLLILDNCEHVLDEAAELAEAVRCSTGGVCLLTTSRAPLHVRGEWVRRLPALSVPPDSGGQTAAEAMRYAAVQLFVERAQAAEDGFALTDALAPTVAEICRRLEGLPLALELAAAHVASFGVRELAAQLRQEMRVLCMERRAAVPRHRTLRATLDWSFAMLPPAEQSLLVALAAIHGPFSLEGALAVAPGGGAAVPGLLASLVDRSLVDLDAGAERLMFRLLETTRAYALERLPKAA